MFNLTAEQVRTLVILVGFVDRGVLDAVDFVAVIGIHFSHLLAVRCWPTGRLLFCRSGLSPPDTMNYTLTLV